MEGTEYDLDDDIIYCRPVGETHGAAIWEIPELYGQTNALEQLVSLKEHNSKIKWWVYIHFAVLNVWIIQVNYVLFNCGSDGFRVGVIRIEFCFGWAYVCTQMYSCINTCLWV